MRSILITILILFSNGLSGQQKAFPTAYGGGAYASGGRGGNVYHVTNLGFAGTPVGSLRWALAQPRPATIVFDVSGTIVFTGSYYIEGDDLTIAGQTAPQGGITFTTDDRTSDLRIGNGTNRIMRFIRIRPKNTSDDAFEVFSGGTPTNLTCHNTILDHCSISYGGDEGFTLRGHGSYANTFQRGIIGESKTGGIFGDSSSFSGTQSYDNSFLTTVFYNITHRTPNISSTERVDMINNVVYNWKLRLANVSRGIKLNHINNYAFLGNKSSVTYDFGTQPTRYSMNCVTQRGEDFDIYTSGNLIEDFYEDPTADNKPQWISFESGDQNVVLPASHFTNTMHTLIGPAIPIMTALEASVNVPDDSGANKFLNADGSVGIYRDLVDTEYVNNIKNNTPVIYKNDGGGDNDSHTFVEGQLYADFLATVSSTPINTRPDNFYNPAKSEHIPEIWFDANVPNGEDHNSIAPSGYTWLEEYLNQVDSEDIFLNPSITLSGSSSIDIDLGGTYTEFGAVATDPTYGNISNDIIIGGDTVDENVVGTYIVTYNVQNADALNAVEVIRTVNVFDFVDVTAVDVNPSTANIEEGESVSLSVTFTPANPTINTGVWSSNNTNASVNENGIVTGDKPGSSTITFTSDDGSFSDTSTITVVDAPIVSAPIVDNVTEVGGNLFIEFSQPANTLAPSGGYDTVLDGVDLNDRDSHTGFTRTITGVDTNIAHTVQIQARYRQFDPSEFIDSEIYNYEVGGTIQVTGINIVESDVSIDENDTYQFTVSFQPNNATDKTLSWSSDNTSVATVDSNGLVTAVSEGIATITANSNDGGFKDSREVTVTQVLSTSAVDLLNAIESDGQFVLTFEQPDNTLIPEGGYDTYINGVDQNDSAQHSGFTRIVSVDDPDDFNTFSIESRYTQLIDPVFPLSNSITVIPDNNIPVLNIEFLPNSNSVSTLINSTYQLELKFTPLLPTSKKGSWQSNNQSVATVSQTGLVSFVGTGTADITFTLAADNSILTTKTFNVIGSIINQNRGTTAAKKIILINN